MTARGPSVPTARWPLYSLAWGLVFAAGWGLGRWLAVGAAVAPGGLDHRAWSWVIGRRDDHPALTALARVLTRLGDAPVAIPLVLAAAAGLLALGRRGAGGLGRWDWLFFLGAMLAARALSASLKAAFGRERPLELHRLVAEDSSSFPSSHALNSAAFCALAAVLLARALHRTRVWRRARWAAYAALAGLAALIAASRVWLAVHYLSDVAIGLALGLAWALAASAIRFGAPLDGRDGRAIT